MINNVVNVILFATGSCSSVKYAIFWTIGNSVQNVLLHPGAETTAAVHKKFGNATSVDHGVPTCSTQKATTVIHISLIDVYLLMIKISFHVFYA